MKKQPTLLDAILKHIHEAETVVLEEDVRLDVPLVFAHTTDSVRSVVERLSKQIVHLEQERKGHRTRLEKNARKIRHSLHHQATVPVTRISQRMREFEDIGREFRRASTALINFKTQLFDIASAYFFRRFLSEKSRKNASDSVFETRLSEVEDEMKKMEREIADIREQQRLQQVLIQDKQQQMIEALSNIHQEKPTKSAETIQEEISEHLETYKELEMQITQKESEKDPLFDLMKKESEDLFLLESLSAEQMSVLYRFKKDLRAFRFGMDLNDASLKTPQEVYSEQFLELSEKEQRFVSLS